ncbi:MAG: helix-turn-helix domain-containing protein [Actinobacteria bacterium]|nr:helix-turn-helix domain-containing protein [Actinomycetota bacterium]
MGAPQPRQCGDVRRQACAQRGAGSPPARGHRVARPTTVVVTPGGTAPLPAGHRTVPKPIRQIERAQQAATLLQRGNPISDAVHEVGYFDQPHLTRSLKQWIGLTPAQILRSSAPG